MTCSLCGLESGSSAFCCAGCQNVYAILLESGVLASGQDFRQSDLYLQSLKLGLISNRAAALPEIPADAETREAVYRLSGMWCASCGWLIEHALMRSRGVVSAEVMFASDLLRVRYCPQYLPVERVTGCVEALGYKVSEYPGRNSAGDAERKDLLLRLGIAVFLWMNVMTFSLVVYTSYFQKVGSSFTRYIPFLLMVLATPAVFYCAAPVLRIAANGLRLRMLRMESLLAMGILTAYGYSVVLTFASNEHVYFDTVCAIVALVLAGKTIERAAKEKTARAITLLHGLMPNKARMMVDGREHFVSIEALRPGGVFRVKSGERIPADGIVRQGRSHTDESVLTGESVPRPKEPGDAVVGGSINVGGVLEIEATRVGEESALALIVQTVERASATRTETERAVDRVARLFIPGVLAISLLTCLGWLYFTGSVAGALMHAIAVMVIACPCALGIATPLALTAAVAAASHRGILVRDARVLETIRDVDVVVLDKTGTATMGEFVVLEVKGDASRMRELSALESFSEHPIAKAIVAYGGAAANLCVEDVSLYPGMGLSGVIGETRYFIGNGKLAQTFCEAVEAGPSVYFGWDGAVRGSILLGDRVRPDAAALCASLRRRGVRTVLLSGDSQAATEKVAAEIGASEWRGDAAPEEKVAAVRALQESGARVAMVGDGVNDAPSLAQSDLGIALGSGTDIAMQAAPLVLMGTSLEGVTETLDLAKHAFRIVRQNLFWAFAYNVAGITLAVTGVLTPILAAAAMVLSSLSVIGNSRRLG